MRNLVLLFTALIFGATGTIAASTSEDKVAESNAYGTNNSFIFVEGGITFSVYPDGEFDFYIDNQVTGHRDGITFNSGYDYSPYAQYDDYGAVIQVENVPIYYDYYGRVTQIGDVDISYRHNRVYRMGGMYVYYNNNGYYDYHTGYINVYNRYYVFSPFHAFFARPALGFCLVFNSPYRRYYTPYRYTYYSPYRYNLRHAYAQIGKEYRYNKVRPERSTIYRNDKRVALRENNARSNRSVAARSETARSDRGVSSRSNTVRSTDSGRSQRSVRTSTGSKGDANIGRTVTKRTVTKTPEARTVTRSTTSVQPVARETRRSVPKVDSKADRNVAQKSIQRAAPQSVSRSTNSVSRKSSTPQRTITRSSTSRTSAKMAPSRSSSSSSRSVATRSRGGQQK